MWPDRYVPEVVQVLANEDYKAVVYFGDGKIVEKDMTDFMDMPVMQSVRDPEAFVNCCCLANGTLAWDPEGTRDPTRVIDFDPFELYDLPSANGIWANAS